MGIMGSARIFSKLVIFKQIFKLELGLVFTLTEPKSDVTLSTLRKEESCVRAVGQDPGLTEFKTKRVTANSPH